MKLPQLSLRELFLLVALAAMGCGWWVDRQARLQETSAMRTRMSGLINEINRLELEAMQRQFQRAQSGWPLPDGASTTP